MKRMAASKLKSFWDPPAIETRKKVIETLLNGMKRIDKGTSVVRGYCLYNIQMLLEYLPRDEDSMWNQLFELIDKSNSAVLLRPEVTAENLGLTRLPGELTLMVIAYIGPPRHTAMIQRLVEISRMEM